MEVSHFKTTKGLSNRFQLNFRNHRKIVLVDGRVAYVGGHNVGDEYLGRSTRFGPWRDTHVKITGPKHPSGRKYAVTKIETASALHYYLECAPA